MVVGDRPVPTGDRPVPTGARPVPTGARASGWWITSGFVTDVSR